jgi:hypothetical protein
MMFGVNNTSSTVDTGKLLDVFGSGGQAPGILGQAYAIITGGESHTLTLRGVFDRTGDANEGSLPGGFAGKGVILMARQMGQICPIIKSVDCYAYA